MTATRYKAVRHDGRDFRTGTVDYLAGGLIVAPRRSLNPGDMGRPSTYLSVSTEPADCTGLVWDVNRPPRLLLVDPVYEWTPPGHPDLPNKRACRALRVVGERPGHELLGPCGEMVVHVIDTIRGASAGQLSDLAAAGDAAWAAAWDAAWHAAWHAARAAAWDAAARAAAWDAALAAARDAAWYAAWDAAGDAARAALIHDLIGHHGYTQQHHDILTAPYRAVFGDPWATP